MSRRNKPPKRPIEPDPIYGSELAARFVNRMMLKGKKSTAQRVLYGALTRLEGKADKPPIQVFHEVLNKVRPLVRVKARRVGGSTYQVPIEVREEEGIAIGSRWLIAAARSRSGRSMVDKLSNEILDAYKDQGAAMRKREETHRMAESNKAFAHYRF